MRSVTRRTFLLVAALLLGVAACAIFGRALAIGRVLLLAEIAGRGFYFLGRIALFFGLGLWLLFALGKKRE